MKNKELESLVEAQKEIIKNYEKIIELYEELVNLLKENSQLKPITQIYYPNGHTLAHSEPINTGSPIITPYEPTTTSGTVSIETVQKDVISKLKGFSEV